MSKEPVSPEQKSLDRRNRYLLKKFNITLADKEQRAREQHGLCLVCGGALDAHGPSNVDHYHGHFDALRRDLGWVAYVVGEDGNPRFHTVAKTKAAALREVKLKALPWLIRALLCAKCNKGLGYIERFFDAARHPENLDTVKAYFVRRLEKIRSTI